MAPTLEGQIAAVKVACSTHFDNDETSWTTAFRLLTPAEQSLAVVCPNPICRAEIGKSCKYPDGTECSPCPTRIALVSDNAAVPESQKCDEPECICDNEVDSRCPVNHTETSLGNFVNDERDICPHGFCEDEHCEHCNPKSTEREKVELPELDVTESDKAAAMEWNKEIVKGAVDNSIPVSWFACRERQLLSALEEVKHLELVNELNLVAHDGWKSRAESAEAKVADLQVALGLSISLHGCASKDCTEKGLVRRAEELRETKKNQAERISALESAVRQMATVIQNCETKELHLYDKEILNLPVVQELLKGEKSL